MLSKKTPNQIFKASLIDMTTCYPKHVREETASLYSLIKLFFIIGFQIVRQISIIISILILPIFFWILIPFMYYKSWWFCKHRAIVGSKLKQNQLDIMHSHHQVNLLKK